MDSEKKMLYILAVMPHEPNTLRLFESGDDSISEMLRRETGIRDRGWDLSFLEKPKIINGEYLEEKSDDKKLDLFEDGRVICTVTADFLAWPLDEEEFRKKPRLNPLALVELTYNFTKLYAKLIPFFAQEPKRMRFVIQLKNSFLDKDTKLYLTPYALNSIDWTINRADYKAPENEMNIPLDLPISELQKEPARVAFLILEKVYDWFQMSKDCIPYVSGEKGSEYVDREKIIHSKF